MRPRAVVNLPRVLDDGRLAAQPELSDDGSVARVEVEDSTGAPLLDQTAINAYSKWRFKPGMKDGKPVPVMATIEVNFRLL